MAFGRRVKELLDTYSQCLKHLGGPRAAAEAPANNKLSVSSSRPSVSNLYRTLESDRGRVRRRYSARLSETGSRLAKGDGHARSALRRIIRRLQDVLTELLDSRKAAGGPLIDYDSLCSLSKASRIGAVETIDALSVRLGSHRAGARHSSRSLDKTNQAAKQTKRHPDTAQSSHGHEKVQPARQRKKLRSSKRQPDEKASATRRKEADGKLHRDKQHPDSSISKEEDRRDRRISRFSASSGSTRLGFIPEHKWAQSDETRDTEDEGYYNVRPTYPLRPYHRPVEKRKGFWSFLRRSA